MTIASSTVVFRCDAGPTIGLGHLARSAVLARALGDAGLRTVLLTDAPTGPAAPWLACFDAVAPAADVVAVRATARAAGALVVDGYALVDEYFARRSAEPFVRVAIDDGPPRALDLDVLVDPNLLQSDSGRYALAAGATVLTGAAYALLGPSVVAARPGRARVPAVAQRLLVTCGAADPAGMTERYLDALAVAQGAYAPTVVVGPLNSRRAALVARARGLGARVVVDGSSLAELFAAHDLALTTLGGTAAELACLAVPALATAIHERQVPHLARYAAAGVVVAVDPSTVADPARLARVIDGLARDATQRGSMAARGMELVDGRGAARVAGAVLARLGEQADARSGA